MTKTVSENVSAPKSFLLSGALTAAYGWFATVAIILFVVFLAGGLFPGFTWGTGVVVTTLSVLISGLILVGQPEICRKQFVGWLTAHLLIGGAVLALGAGSL